MDVLVLIERFAGWGVVIVICFWMMKRIEALIDTFKAALDSFDSFEKAEEDVHVKILEGLNALTETIKKLIDRLDRESDRRG